MMVKIKQHIFNGENLKKGLLVLVVFAIVFTIFQDFLHSNFNNYNFHFSESLLFKSFWLLFLPFLLFQFRFLAIYLYRSQKKKAVIIILAIALPSLLHIISFPIMVWGLSYLLFDHSYRILDTLNYTLAEDLYKYIFVYGLAALAFIYREAKYQPIKQPIPFLQKIVINTGRNYITIPTTDILFIDTAAPYLAIHTAQNTYLHTETLKSIGEKLDPKQFIRVHKSTLINMSKVVSYKSRLNGDYDLSLSNEKSVRLSRNYAAAFKALLHLTQ